MGDLGLTTVRLREAADTDTESAAGGRPTLVAGRNCWRIEKARHLSFLVDGAEYFGAVRKALLQARRSFCILGWDIDSRMRLAPGADDGLPELLGDFFEAILARNPALSGRILSWDYAMLYAFEREWPPIFATGWRDHPRVEFRLDSRHPVGASHHQKVIVVDDEVAFVGGFDLAGSRWDTCDHAFDEPLRVNCGGLHYGPFHDVATIADGACAAALGELFGRRWQLATGEALPVNTAAPQDADGATLSSAWPVGVVPALYDVDVAISRTEPQFAGSDGVDELRQLHLDAIACARTSIVAENQYFTSRIIADAFARRLAEADPPELAIVAPQTQSGWLESSTMGVLRSRIHAQLRVADRLDRYVLYCPTVQCEKGASSDASGAAGPADEAHAACINVHSKVLIVDDELISIGSANLSNRSLCLDTECNLTLEANGRMDIREAVAGMRARLLGEHLGVESREVETAIRRECSVHRAITSLDRHGVRRLRRCEPALDPALDAVVPDHDVLDPESPIDPEVLVRELVPRRSERHSLHGRVAGWMVGLVAVVAAALAWRYSGLGFPLEVGEVTAVMTRVSESPWAWMVVPLMFVVTGFALVPVTLLVALTAALFGPVLGGGLAMAGAIASAATGYATGCWLGRDVVRKYGGRRLNHLSQRLARRGLVAVLMVRLLPIAPFTVVNLVAGASHVGWRNFLLGTALGLAPGVVLVSAFVDRAAAMAQDPGVPGALGLGVVIALMLAVALFLRRRFGASRGPEPAAAGVD